MNDSEINFQIGDVVSLKGSPKLTGLVREIVEKKVDNSPSGMVYLYKVFWFTGIGSSKTYVAADLALEPSQPERRGKIY